MEKHFTHKQYFLFTLGTILNAFGIAIITKSYMGTSPISSLPFVLSLGLPPSFGTFTFIFNMIFLGGQILLLRKQFEKIQLLQIPVTMIFSLLIDLFMTLLDWIKPETYLVSLPLLGCGCCIMALGITLSIRAHFIMTPADAFVRALAAHIQKPFGNIKICFDLTLMILAAISSFVLFGYFRGVREGTLISALLVGSVINFYQKVLDLAKKNPSRRQEV